MSTRYSENNQTKSKEEANKEQLTILLMTKGKHFKTEATVKWRKLRDEIRVLDSS